MSPHLCEILRKDVLYDLGLHRAWADVDDTDLGVVSQLSPKRIKKTLEDKTIMLASSATFPCVARFN